jgi:hypothetical protein
MSIFSGSLGTFLEKKIFKKYTPWSNGTLLNIGRQLPISKKKREKNEKK